MQSVERATAVQASAASAAPARAGWEERREALPWDLSLPSTIFITSGADSCQLGRGPPPPSASEVGEDDAEVAILTVRGFPFSTHPFLATCESCRLLKPFPRF